MAAWVTDRAVTPAAALGQEVVDRIAHLSSVHDDGWGAAWVDPAGAHHTHRSVHPAYSDPDFEAFTSGTRTRACFVHIRLGTPGYGTGIANVHPFTREGWAFAHNGAILPATRIHRLLSSRSGRKPESQTDSEVYFLALLDEMDNTAGDLAPAIGAVIGHAADSGLQASSLNATLLGPGTLAVISHHDPSAADSYGVRLWPDDERAAGVVWPDYHPMLHSRHTGFEGVVSSGLIPESVDTGWHTLANDVVWSADLETRRSAVTPIVHAETSPADGPHDERACGSRAERGRLALPAVPQCLQGVRQRPQQGRAGADLLADRCSRLQHPGRAVWACWLGGHGSLGLGVSNALRTIQETPPHARQR